jgi:DtxR family transcriptional regulator, Mn-dependent transcriptional regulator
MVKKLAALGLAAHEPYRGVTLTHAGEKVALEIIRHHRLLELYLAQTLGLDVADVHDEAERLEHAISEELEAKIDRALGYPTHDPHGDPIPDAELRWPAAKRPVRDSGPVEGVRGNREVPPTTTQTARKSTAPKASAARRARTA